MEQVRIPSPDEMAQSDYDYSQVTVNPEAPELESGTVNLGSAGAVHEVEIPPYDTPEHPVAFATTEEEK